MLMVERQIDGKKRLTFSRTSRVAAGSVLSTIGLGRAQQYRVVSVSLDVLLQVLRTLECLATEVALVRLERDVNTDVRRDVVALNRGGAAVSPLAGEVQVVGAFATNVTLTNVILHQSCQYAVADGTCQMAFRCNLRRAVRLCCIARHSWPIGRSASRWRRWIVRSRVRHWVFPQELGLQQHHPQ